MKVLIACEFSGTVRDAFSRRGHSAISCDIEDSEKPGKHYKGDVRDLLSDEWDLIIAHPPCTYLTNSGVRHLYTETGRRDKMYDAAKFFNSFLTANTDKLAIENPVPHKYAREIIGDYSQLIQPWEFGHGETKATCLWLWGLPYLEPTNIVAGREARIHKMAPGPNRSKDRSRTYTGIAEAMAEQWGYRP